MSLLLRSLTLAFSSLSDRVILGLLVKSILVTFGIFTLFAIVAWFAVQGLVDDYASAGGWSEFMAGAIVLIGVGLGGWLLFRAVAIAVIWFFSDDIVMAVERKNYPFAAEMARPASARTSAKLAGRSILRFAGYNLAAVPVYLLLALTGIGLPIAFLAVNALLLARDLEDMMLARHPGTVTALAKRDRLLLGLVGTAGMMVPLVNLVVPVIATATAVHLMHQRRERRV